MPPSISDTARIRRANIKATGGFPPKAPPGQALTNDAKQVKVRQKYEDELAAEVGAVRPKRKVR